MDQSAIFLATAAGSLSAIIFGYVGYLKGNKKDTYLEGESKGAQQADIAYIKKQTDNILFEQRDTNRHVNMLSERITRVEESAKSAHKRIDQIEEKGGVWSD